MRDVSFDPDFNLVDDLADGLADGLAAALVTGFAFLLAVVEGLLVLDGLDALFLETTALGAADLGLADLVPFAVPFAGLEEAEAAGFAFLTATGLACLLNGFDAPDGFTAFDDDFSTSDAFNVFAVALLRATFAIFIAGFVAEFPEDLPASFLGGSAAFPLVCLSIIYVFNVKGADWGIIIPHYTVIYRSLCFNYK